MGTIQLTKILLSTYYVSSPVLVRCSDRVVIIYDFTELTITDKTSDNFLLNRNIFFIIDKMLCDYFTKILYDLVHLVTLYNKSLPLKCCALTLGSQIFHKLLQSLLKTIPVTPYRRSLHLWIK